MINRTFGVVKSPPDNRDYIYSAIKPITTALPTRFLLPEWPVNNQGQFGSCVGQAASAIKDYQEAKERGEVVDTSPLYVYSKCKQQDGLAQAGTYPRTAMSVLAKSGICSEVTFPYKLMNNDVKPPTASAIIDQEAQQYKIKSYARINALDEIKQAILSDGPVLIALLWTSAANTPEQGFLPMPSGSILGGHAVAVTGWDDNLNHTYKVAYKGKHTFKGFLRVRNSWGAAWGDLGYCWIPYELFTDTDADTPPFMEAWTTVDIVKDQPKTKLKIIITPGQDFAMVDGFKVPLDQPAEIDPATNRLMVPIRFVSENLGCVVQWDGKRAVIIRGV